MEKTDECSALFELLDFLKIRWLDFEHYIGLSQHLGLNTGALFQVACIRKPSLCAGTGLDKDLQTRCRQLWRKLGNQGYASLSRDRLFWNAQDHSQALLVSAYQPVIPRPILEQGSWKKLM